MFVKKRKYKSQQSPEKPQYNMATSQYLDTPPPPPPFCLNPPFLAKIFRPPPAIPSILIDCMIFLSPFLNVTGISMSTVSFLAQLGSGILCL